MGEGLPTGGDGKVNDGKWHDRKTYHVELDRVGVGLKENTETHITQGVLRATEAHTQQKKC